jgi:hypothetical protein
VQAQKKPSAPRLLTRPPAPPALPQRSGSRSRSAARSYSTTSRSRPRITASKSRSSPSRRRCSWCSGCCTIFYTIALPGEGGALAITDDAKKLYVAIGGSAPSVARIDIASRTVETPFVLGKNSSGSTLYAAYLAPVPGHPELIGIVHAAVGSAVGSEGLYLHRDGVRVHPNQKKWQTNTDNVFLDVTAAVFTSDTRAYALNGATTRFHFSAVDITPQGLRVSQVRTDILDDFNILPVLKDGKLFIGDRVVDPMAPRVLGDVRSTGAVALDDSGSHAYYAVFDYDRRRIGVECFDTKTYARTGAIVVDALLPESVQSAFARPQLMLWGHDGLAMKVDNTGATKLLLMPSALRGVPGCEPGVSRVGPHAGCSSRWRVSRQSLAWPTPAPLSDSAKVRR